VYISIALCTFNGECYLNKQLESLLSQTIQPSEIRVFDDKSTDGTIEILNAYVSRFPGLFHITVNESSLGARKNFEKALNACTGDFIFLCDQDDSWYENKIEKTIQFFKYHPEADGVFSNGLLMNEQEESLGETMWDALYFEKDIRVIVNNNNLLYYLLLNGNIATGTALAFRGKAKSLILPFQLTDETWHDHWIALKLAALSRLFFLDEILLRYRIHDQQQVGFQGRAKSNPGFREAVRSTWLNELNTDPEGIKTRHFAWAWQSYKNFNKALSSENDEGNQHLHIAGDLIQRNLNKAKTSWLRNLPFLKRKNKLIKHYLKGGEYLRISFSDIFFI
jgi:glycosyltransferase involved in cell wall biosynthesis